MLTFLRKIRRSLLDSGSTQKYLLYAIGEIALVVIGILIALQINNWNEQRKKQKMEVHFIEMILSDADGSIEDLEHTIRGAQRRINSGKWLIQELSLSGEKIDSIDISYLSSPNAGSLSNLSKSLYFLGLTNTFQSSQSAYEELTSSGNIAVIKEFQLRSRITLFYKELKDREETNQRHLESENRYVQSLQDAGISMMDERTPEVVENHVLNSQSVQAAIRNQTGMAEAQMRECSDIINYINTFKQEILTSYQGAQQD